MLTPPPKSSKPTPQNVALLQAWLTEILAFHPRADGQPWLFYEEIDRYLGPWGASGYPIAYGKKYCQLFWHSHDLNNNLTGARWVHRTLLLLQTELMEFILARYKSGTLDKLTEAELRAAAFESHPKAYTEGGLTMVILMDPPLMPNVRTIISIPAKEFFPNSPTFGPTIRQLVATAQIVIPQGVATALAGIAGPAHNQTLGYAFARDQRAFLDLLAQTQRLAVIEDSVKSGFCDHIGLLLKLKQSILLTRFDDPGLSHYAAALVNAIDARIVYVRSRYHREVAVDPELQPIFRSFDPGY